MALSLAWLCKDRSVPRGRYWRSNLLVFSFEPRCQGDRGPIWRNDGSANQISQPAEPNALSKPPNVLSRHGSVSPAAFRRSEVVARLTSAFLGFDFGAAVATFFGLGSCRRRSITLGGSDGPTLAPSGGGLRSPTRAACAGVSMLAAATSSRSAFSSRSALANAPRDSEMPAAISATGRTCIATLRAGVLSSIAASTPTPNGMRRPNNIILSMMFLRLELAPVRILRSNEATWRRPT
jgi:hypothetical protein